MATANGLGTLLSSRLAPREEEEEEWWRDVRGGGLEGWGWGWEGGDGGVMGGPRRVIHGPPRSANDTKAKGVAGREGEKCPRQHIAHAGVSWRTIKGP